MPNRLIKVLSVNTSEKKGTIKKPVKEINITSKGIENDAHAGSWGRQVSLLAIESIAKFEAYSGKKFSHGEFAENITLKGFDLVHTHPLDHFQIGDVQLEITQIGKKCHGKTCHIFKDNGDCIMPKEGVFTRVLATGKVKPGDIVHYHPKIFRLLVITLSDRASSGLYEDKSGPEVKQIIESFFKEKGRKVESELNLIPDDPGRLALLIKLAVQKGFDMVITTGGTGLSPTDITIDTVEPMLQKKIPGIMEHIRTKYGDSNPAALLSRSVAGVIDKSLVFCLPGSVNAVEEYLTEITKVLEHLVYTINGLDLH